MSILETYTVTPGNTVVPPWGGVQYPRIRGVQQTTRVTTLGGTDVPGDANDPNRPATATKFELRSYHNNDFTVTLTADALATDTVISLSSSDAALLAPLDFINIARTAENIRVVSVSGTSVTIKRAQQSKAAALVANDVLTVLCGDVNDSGGSDPASRVEMLTDLPSPTSLDPALWNLPYNSERWFHWQSFVPTTYTPAGDSTWLVILQLKGLTGGSPPISVEIQRTNWRFGGTRGNGYTDVFGTHAPAYASNGVIGSYNAGTWTDFVLGVYLSPNPNTGWSRLFMNGAEVVPKTTLATMDTKNNDGVTPDPIYLKTGIYRAQTWTTTAVLYHGPMVVADSGVDFGVVAPPPPKASTQTLGEYWGSIAY